MMVINLKIALIVDKRYKINYINLFVNK